MKFGIVLTVILLLFSSLTTSFLFGNDVLDSHYSAEKGVINLSSVDLENKSPLRLDGMWDFRWNELLEPDDSQWNNKQDEVEFYPVPLFWTSYEDQHYSSEGQGTYRLIIETSGQCSYYGIMLPEIFSEYKLWINDNLIDERWNREGDKSII